MQGRMGGHHVHVQGWIQQHFQYNLFRRHRGLRRFLHDQLVLCSHVGAVLVNRRYPKPGGKSQEKERPPRRVLVATTHLSGFGASILCGEKRASLVLSCTVDATFSLDTPCGSGTLYLSRGQRGRGNVLRAGTPRYKPHPWPLHPAFMFDVQVNPDDPEVFQRFGTKKGRIEKVSYLRDAVERLVLFITERGRQKAGGGGGAGGGGRI